MNGINSIRALTPSEEELVSAGVDENPGLEHLYDVNVDNGRLRPNLVPLNRRGLRGNFRSEFEPNYGNPTYFVPNRASLRRSNKRIKHGLWGRVNQPR